MAKTGQKLSTVPKPLQAVSILRCCLTSKKRRSYDILNYILENGNIWIKVSSRYISGRLIHETSLLVQVMAWYYKCHWAKKSHGVPHHPLQWRHNDHDGVSNHQPHGCLLNRLFRRRSKKTSKLRVTGLCAGNSPGPVNSPHKGLVTRKCFYLMTSSCLANFKNHISLIICEMLWFDIGRIEWLTLIPTWISNHMASWVCDKIT